MSLIFSSPELTTGDISRAENGCFIKTRPSRKEGSRWVNMVANFNLTWKVVCLEILNYVRRLAAVIPIMG
jgi:hypothetical protein